MRMILKLPGKLQTIPDKVEECSQGTMLDVRCTMSDDLRCMMGSYFTIILLQ